MVSLFRFRVRDDEGRRSLHSSPVVAFTAALCLATIALVSVGYVAIREWQQGVNLLLERRQAEALALVMAALARDMTGASTSLIVPATEFALREDPPFELQQLAARAFARFPYPETFVTWHSTATGGVTYAFNRTERQPQWNHDLPSDEPFPVVIVRNPPALEPVIRRLQQRATERSPFVVLVTELEGIPYQVLARLFFESPPPYRLSALAALTVNLGWMTKLYFQPLLLQIAQIGGHEDVLSFTVTDERGALVARTVPALTEGRDFQRHFPLLFLDHALVPNAVDATAEWTVHVRPSLDNTLLAAQQGARRMFVLLAVAAAASIVALLLTVRAIQARAVVAAMKSEFVSTVTHEFKTPLSLIRLVGDTLAGGRYTSSQTVQEYAALLSREAARLSRSIDDLLTYARYADPENSMPIEFKPTHLGEVVEDAVEEFRPALEQRQFQLSVEVPQHLPPVAADRASLLRVFENIIDNAIKYSGDRRILSITGSANGKDVVLKFVDRGIGIPKEDIARVRERFFRARNASGRGTGLGLAIVQRIVSRHGGRIEIRSEVNVGTEVELMLPVGTLS